MYKVLFAEDEVLVRLGLKNSIHWEQFDMEVVADEDNGIAAWEKFQECRPDLVITDIKMGGMDGCELIEHIRTLDRECGIIILSCLEDFKILQNMISYNILGYLLKASMTMDEINQLLEEARTYLRGIRRSEIPEGGRPLKPELALQQYLVHKNIDSKLLVTYLRAYGKELPGEVKALILFEIEEADRDKISDLGVPFIQDMICAELMTGFLFYIDEKRFGVLLPQELEEEEEKITGVVLRVRGILNIGIQYYIHVTECSSPDHLLEEYEKCIAASNSLHTGMQTKTADYTINKAIGFIGEHYSHQITLKEVAETVGLSPNYFSAIFKREMKISFISYLTCLRMEKAKSLLSGSNEYLYIIAEKAGFQNFEHFSRIFKQRTGKSPANWRKEMEGMRR